MATSTRIRTLNFLPDVFKTTTNAQFLAATLDQIVAQPNTERIEGYIGTKFGYGINAKNKYVVEPTKTRTDYQLDPGVAFLKKDTGTAQDFISYPGITDALKLEGGITNNNDRLFESQFYSWDSFTGLDKIINFNQYYWLPEGPEPVTISTDIVFNATDYIITDAPNGYNVTADGQTQGSTNPTLTLLRGGTYRFSVNQDSQFWIQGQPGVTGYDPTQTNVQTRDVFGVTNNGAEVGIVTFTVPAKNALDEFNFPGNNSVDVVSTVPFDQINGQLLSTIGGIDGISSLDGLTVMFYNTGVPNEQGYISNFFDDTNFDVNTNLVPAQTVTISSTNSTGNVITCSSTANLIVGQTITFSGATFGGILTYNTVFPNTIYYVNTIISDTEFTIAQNLFDVGVAPYAVTTASGSGLVAAINQGLYEEGYFSDVSATFYRISYAGDLSDPVIRLTEAGLIPTNEAILAQYGTAWVARKFYRNVSGTVNLVPYNSAILDVLYYQDGTSGNKVGQIRIIDSNTANRIDVLADILGKPQYTAPNGVEFTNGLKVTFQGDIYPVSYENIQYYVEGVGTAIELIPVSDLIAPEPFTSSTYIPYDTTPYDIGNYDSNLYIPVTPDYITIARNSINKNPWSRSNRWFHIDVINATATYNNNPDFVTLAATQENKAKRPIIEFYPNLRLFNSGYLGKAPIDFIDFRTTDAFEYVAGQENYYPDVEVYTTYTATINSVTASTTTTISIATSDITGAFQVGQYINDSTNLLPTNSQISNISVASGVTTLTVTWLGNYTFGGTTVASLIANDGQNDNYALFDGARVVFAADTNENVKDKIYVVRFSSIAELSTPVITLTPADDGEVLLLEQTVAFRGFNYQGKDFYFDGIDWLESQQKTTVNQPPLFDIFDENGISLSDSEYYIGTSFEGSKLFAYGLGSGLDDSILGFPIRYSSINNVGDISFDVSLNSDTFNYVRGTTPITQKVNTGYVYNYTVLGEQYRQIGWETAVGKSVQYQIFEFDYTASSPTTTYTCDVSMLSPDASVWPTLQVYVNNVLQTGNYTVTVGPNSTVINFTVPDPLVDTVVQVSILSNQVSKVGYYSIPINLNNNPLNQDITVANVGDIRGQYQSIFYNNPSTTGDVFGANNYRDLGNLVPWGNRIIQNSASLVLPGTFLRKQNHNLFNALMFNSKEYINFKTTLINTVNNTDYNRYFSPAYMLDDALDQITASKTEDESFFWSDMLPSKAAYITNTYSFANSLDVSIYPLSKIYNYDTANYNGILVYLTRTTSGITTTTQLIRDVDYTVSSTNPSLTVETDLLPGDQISINEYNQTYGSYCPNTPTKLGLYPSTIPQVILDSNYVTPTYFIVGHDGSYNKLYGDYIDGQLIDFRDQVLLEFEKRVYNNLKLSNVIPINESDVIPGFWRTTDYTLDEVKQMYSVNFLNWVGQNRVNYKKQVYNANNQYTYNYNRSGNKINKDPIPQGYWRGIYEYFYDTSNPDTKPWEMLGFANQPTWWETRYGAAPYTSDNLVLWEDLAAGYIWNNGEPYTNESFARPELLQVLPVDTAGNLVSPFIAIVGNYANQSFVRDWIVGDAGPTEFSYRRSSTWPFDLMKLYALTKPAEFFNLGVDVDNYKYNTEFNQYLVNDRSHLIISDVEIYGNGTPKTSYINWVVDYEKQIGIDATQNIIDLLDNLDVRLVYRLAGFSDKNLLKFYVEKGTPNSNNASLLIPDESFGVLLYDNQPFERIVYSGVIVQSTSEGYYKVYGNSQTNAYFNVLNPKINGNYDRITLQNISVQVPKDYYETTSIVAYGTEFYSLQEVAVFLSSYGKYLASQGVLFDQIETGLEVSWNQMISEFLYWAQSGWESGSIINLNPAANLISINKDSYIVQPLTLQQQNFILNQNLYPIQSVDMSIVREGTLFSAKPLNQGDTVAYGQFNISNFEHGIVFDNVTLFDDIIYNLITGLRQQRIIVRGTKTAEWNGTIDAQGFILNQDNIVEWNNKTKYTTGSIVLYKNKYWIALKIIQASEVFNERDWKETDYNEVQKGLLPNSSTRSYESTLYYDVNKANLENDADLLSFSLIGYRPRDYLALVDLTDITQINVYKNFIRNKGTKNAVNAFKGASLPQGGIDYEVYENWAIKAGEFGGVLNSNFVEFKLNQSELTGNPSTVELTNGTFTNGIQQQVPLYNIFNYGRPITSPNVLPTLPIDTPNTLFPDAGYVNFDDVKTHAYYYFGLTGAETPITRLYQGDYVWLANLQGTWQIMSPLSLGTVVEARNLSNGTITIKFATAQTLTKYSAFAVTNFDNRINGYYTVAGIVDPYTVLVRANLNPEIQTITGQGIAFKFQSHRAEEPSDIINLPLLDNEFVKNKVWVDLGNEGSWQVYRKSLNYTYDSEIVKTNSQSFGSAVAYTDNVGYLIADANAGEMYRYIYNALTEQYEPFQTYTGSASFGTTISYSGDIFVVSQPLGASAADRTISIYQLVSNTLINSLELIQEPIQAPESSITNWGSATAISGDQNWLYVSDTVNNRVYVYRKSQITGKYEYANIITVTGVGSSDQFGYSLSTDYYGHTLVVGTPDQNYSATIDNSGYSYIFDRLYQNFEAQSSSQPFIPLLFNLAVATNTTAYNASITMSISNKINVGTVQGLSIGTPAVFTGPVFGDISLNTVYYIRDTFSPANQVTLSTNKLIATVDTTYATGNKIRVSGNSGFVVNAPIVFYGETGTSNIVSGTKYYIKSITTVTVDTVNYDAITISTTIGGTTFTVSNSDLNVTAITFGNEVPLSSDTGTMTLNAQTQPVFLSVNGTIIPDDQYAVIGNTLNMYGNVTAGDIITVNTSTFTLMQRLATGTTPRVGVQFGQSVASNKYASEILVGAPFQLSDTAGEGAVYRFTNGGSKYGMIVGTTDCNLSASAPILINGYSVTLPIGGATGAANAINAANITNVQAANVDGKLVISLINASLATINDKLNIAALSSDIYIGMGITPYTLTQTITCPHVGGATQFGAKVKFNEFGSFVVSAPTGTRFTGTTFDSSDDENFDNDTIFDNNTTQWVDTFVNAGAVYMYDYLSNYNENLLNIGNFVYAQSVNDLNREYGDQPYYGQAIDFNNYTVIVGSPQFRPSFVNGQVVVYTNPNKEQDWVVFRESTEIVDTSRIQNGLMYSAITNNTLENLDYIDPLQGKLLGVVRENIDFISNIDPASYNSPSATNRGSSVWGSPQVGELWFDTSNTRFVNYHQPDATYNSKWWGRVFPGSNVAVYSWVQSSVVPSQYAGPGVPYNTDTYAIELVQDARGSLVPQYFYWVRNTNTVFTKLGKTLSDTILEYYIINPINSGISYFAPLLPNAFALYNSDPYINNTDTIFHVGFSTGTNDDEAHSVYNLIRSNYADDFLPGLPTENSTDIPESLYDRLLDSLAGVDETGAVVPDPYLPKPVQYGIYARPRQSFFVNRFGALKNYLQYANEILAQFPITEIRSSNFLFQDGGINPSTVNNPNWSSGAELFYDTQQYWNYTDWWATGYNSNTKSALRVPLYADLSTLSVPSGTIVTVAQNGDGKFEVYRSNDDSTWTRIGLENGTIEFTSQLWDYAEARLGFGDNFFDTTPYDEFPSQETRYILRALNEQIYTQELQIYRNKSLILLFEYIQTETIESQNYLPWLNKTSFIDVGHTIRELLPIEVFQTDNQDFLQGYLNEVKPYHVVIKEFLFKYTGEDVYDGDITDFDLPAQYNSTIQKFVSPELVYANPSSAYEFLPTDPIWETQAYNQWFNNFGLSITGVNDYPITTLSSYISLNSNSFTVDNSFGFPINGVVLIDSELIAYSNVDRSTNTLSGLTRGIDGTTITTHIPGAQLTIDLPAVLLLDGGRGYTEPPKVTAYYDEALYGPPKRAAQLEVVMFLDSVLAVNVIDPGAGYPVLPEIRIDPSISILFDSTQVSTLTDTIVLDTPLLQTGDLIKYVVGDNTTAVGGLDDGQYYYVNVLETAPAFTVALYTNYGDAVNDQRRVVLFNQGAGSSNRLNLSARASCVSTSIPIRQNQITLRFDRTSYTSRVTDWESGAFYGSFYAGLYNNSESIASSSIGLQSTQPPISDILASAAGAAFEINSVENDESLTWSSRTRNVTATVADNKITIIESAGGTTQGLSGVGPTIGFYVGMPVKFEGAVGTTGLVNGTTYYVAEVTNDSQIKISATDGGGIFSLNAESISVAGLLLYVGQVNPATIININYPGIRQVTATTANTNKLTVPLTLSGQGGTSEFYTNLPVFFIGNVFGGIIENETYYVTTVVDNQTFTLSTEQDPLILDVTGTSSIDNLITCNSTLGLTVNDPIIFTDFTIASGTTNLVEGTTYYVQSIYSGTQFRVSTNVNSGDIDPGTATLTGNVTNQKDTVVLTTATGSMTMNVGLPVSPGQITGQQFTFYTTSPQYSGRTGTDSNLIERVVPATVTEVTSGEGGWAFLTSSSGGLTDVYVNMPIEVDTNYGGLTAGTVYYVTEADTIETTVTITTAGNELICTSTDGFYVGMPIVFSGVSLGGAQLDFQYYVESITGGTSFKIAETPTGSEVDLTSDSGSMNVLGETYIKVATSLGGTPIALTTVTASETNLTQVPNPTGSDAATFDVSSILGGYRVIVTNDSSGYAVDNIIVINGSDLGGTDGVNDLTMTVNTIGANGQLISLICSGTPAGTQNNYYLKVISANQCEVYGDPLLQIPVAYDDFAYTGIRSTTATSIDGDTEVITVTSSADFAVNDPVVFTGSVFGGLNVGQVYYILSVTPTTVTVSETIGGDVFDLSTATGTMYMAKSGDYALLPEPFFFNQSVVKYNNKVYQCIVSNNDSEFIFGKWEVLDSGSRELNALDRIVGYYQPTVNMPGLDLTQLVNGITYPNSTYYGNAFAPDDEYELDTILQDQPFYPTEIDTVAIVWNGVGYIGAANGPEYSAVIASPDNTDWVIDNISNQPVGVTDIGYSGSKYVITTSNPATPIYTSPNGTVWSTNGSYTPYGSTPYDEIPYDVTALVVESNLLNSVSYLNNKWVAVGNNIVTSDDATVWRETDAFTNGLSNVLNGVVGANTTNFTGFVAVGKGQEIVSGITTDVSLLKTSPTGTIWSTLNTVSTKGFNAVTASSTQLVIVGEDGIIYTSQNGVNWLGVNEAVIVSVNGSSNEIIVPSTAGFQVGDTVRFTSSFDTISSSTSYTITDIPSTTQVQVNETLTGVVPTITTYMYLYPRTETLNDVHFANGIFVAVGNTGAIKTSTDAYTWTPVTSGTTQNLNGVNYNIDDNVWVIVGDNNVILQSTDNGITWESSSVFLTDPTVYNVQGDPFLSGYGPEEMVPGVVTDNLTMIVTTRPGTNWNATEYQHVGYNVVSTEIVPSSGTQTMYSFDNLVQIPAQIAVWQLDGITGLGTRLYDGYDYVTNSSSNWFNKIVELNNPLPLGDTLRIDVYEVGNGDQLVKSNSQTDPIRINNITGFNEIYLNCNYSGTRTSGSGVIRQGTEPLQTVVTVTNGSTDSMLCSDVSTLTINQQITFQGDVFGGVAVDTTYYVKTISNITNTITISDSIASGVAGSTLQLTSGTGSMDLIIQVGSGTVWSDPIAYHNGNKLIFGTITQISQTKSSTNTVVCNSTGGIAINDRITFSDTMIGGLTPQTTYYVLSVIDGNEFTVSLTQGGAVVTLTDDNGGALAVTNDYAFGQVTNSITAKIIFSAQYIDEDIALDGYPTNSLMGTEDGLILMTESYTSEYLPYITYTVFGETQPEQYGYTIPETEVFLVPPSPVTSFALSNYAGNDNADNAVVERNGLRLVNTSDYNINPGTGILTLTFAPDAGDKIAVTTYNLTERQYLHTNYGGSFSGSVTTSLAISDTTHQPGYDTVNYDIGNYSPSPDYLTLGSGSTSSLNVNDAIIFSAPTLGGINSNQIYYVSSILDSSTFAISETIGGDPIELITASGSMSASVNPPTVANIVAIDNAITPAIATTLVTSATGTVITGTSTAGFVLGQTIIFKSAGSTIGNIVNGEYYYVESIIDGTDFTISETQGGTPFIVDVGTVSGTLVASVGGLEAVRITTGVPHNLVTNDIVRIDGTTGSTQLNNNTYYVKVVNDTQVDLYTATYNPDYAYANSPVVAVSAYTGGGYIWLNQTFTLLTTVARQTYVSTNRIRVDSTSELVEGTPIIFTGSTPIGNLVSGTTYYVKTISSGTEFTVSATRDGSEFVQVDDTGIMGATQWEQVNVDRLWVTVNGYRVPSSSLVINPDNNLSILTTIVTGDVIVITSMMPTATPNEEVYINNVNKNGIATVYRANTETRTWLTSDLFNTSEIVYVNDVTRLTNQIVQNVTAPAAVDGITTVGLTADKRIICQVIVYNNTTGATLSTSAYSVVVENIAPVVKITSGVTAGDSLTVTTIEGNVVYINGEQIRFSSVDFSTNALSGLQRGANGTGEQTFIPEYSEVYGILTENRLTQADYFETWNSYIYNPTDGDPLQISLSMGANFLREDVS
jgi:hypothetical protein